MNYKIIGMVVTGLFFAVLPFFTGEKKTKDKAVGKDDAIEAKKALMREMGKKGGKASAAKRKVKKASKKVEADDVQP